MVLTFTGSLSIAGAGRDDVRTMLVGALGCNLAWGIIDGVLYVMGALAERGRDLATYRAVREAKDLEAARGTLASALPGVVARVLTPAELDELRSRLETLPEPPRRAHVTREDVSGATSVFLLVFLSTFPVALPFVFLQDARFALRVSNGIAIAMLLLLGLAYGRCIGRSPVLVGVGMVALGALLVALTMALGG